MSDNNDCPLCGGPCILHTARHIGRPADRLGYRPTYDAAAMAEPADRTPRNYQVLVEARQMGAIGVFSPLRVNVTAETPADAVRIAFDVVGDMGYEHSGKTWIAGGTPI